MSLSNTSEIDFPECSVCFTCYDEDKHKPNILSECGHTFCEVCIKCLKTKYTHLYKCPVCKQENSNYICKNNIFLTTNNTI